MFRKRAESCKLTRLATMLAMVFVLLAPSLAPVFAAPVLTDEQLLLRDIAHSRCAGASDDQRGSRIGCDQCSLCRTIVDASHPAKQLQELLSQRPLPRSISVIQAWRTPFTHPHSSQTGPPRAPPSIS